jgi:hypothetical protein
MQQQPQYYYPAHSVAYVPAVVPVTANPTQVTQIAMYYKTNSMLLHMHIALASA